MGNYTITPAVIKARQKQMNIPKRIFALEGRAKGWSDETIAVEWFKVTGEKTSDRAFNQMRARIASEGYTLEELYKLRKEQQND